MIDKSGIEMELRALYYPSDTSNFEAVRKNGLYLQYIEKQTEVLCLAAVRQNPRAIKFVKKQTPEICLEAVKRNGNALEYVINQTPLIIHYLKKYNMSVYKLYKEDNRIKKENRITISDNEMKKFYNENPHLLLTL